MQRRKNIPSSRALTLFGSVTITLAACIYWYYNNNNSNDDTRAFTDLDNQDKKIATTETDSSVNLCPKYSKSTTISLLVSPSIIHSHTNYTILLSEYLKIYPNLTLVIHPNVSISLKSKRIIEISNLKSIPFILSQLNSNINLLNLQDSDLQNISSPSLNRLSNVIPLNEDIKFIDII
ncbi:hypothetical protein C6P40_002776 [Pichia californica]|uniref:Peroxisome assembly protein 22 n=1 Tax=Pichia californica TaxID=460514 RepID=A0A9P7BF02_9ASCO|nr:hypothetical protein C6P42_003232 [[Candida] californica]KAG0687169.1 hypothetical protein C6P40_002776 [[Candida] californica]